jgi:Domain of unknown function (DUF6431)
VSLFKTRTGRCKRFGGLIFLFSTAYAIFIVLNSYTDVKPYLVDVADGLPETERPSCCKYCQTSRKPHRHGQFKRWLNTLTERILMPVFRFLCFDCKRTMSVLPDLVEPYHQDAIEVKEVVVTSAEAGESTPAIAARSNKFAGGPYSEKTLRRWLRAWRQRFTRHQDRLWALLIHAGMDRELPRERNSDILALSTVWSGLPESKCLFSTLLLLDRSTRLTEGHLYPTLVGHSLPG